MATACLSFPWLKRPEHESHHLYPHGAEFQSAERWASTTQYLRGMTVNWTQRKVFPLYLNSFTGVVLHAKDYTFMLGDHRMCFKILHALFFYNLRLNGYSTTFLKSMSCLNDTRVVLCTIIWMATCQSRSRYVSTKVRWNLSLINHHYLNEAAIILQSLVVSLCICRFSTNKFHCLCVSCVCVFRMNLKIISLFFLFSIHRLVLPLN